VELIKAKSFIFLAKLNDPDEKIFVARHCNLHNFAELIHAHAQQK
jgi:hypothetical protein